MNATPRAHFFRFPRQPSQPGTHLRSRLPHAASLTAALTVSAVVATGCSGDPSEAVIVSDSAVAASDSPTPSVGSPTTVLGSVAAPTGGSEPPSTVDNSELGVVPDSVPEVGVPGLDSDDEFCSAWSAWAGSQQVIAVTANFSDPATVPSLEVAAAPTLVGAYDTMMANWPDAIAEARDVGANDYFGPMYGRSSEALAALNEVGTDDTTIETIQAAWFQGLEQRDPTTPEFSVDLPDEAWNYVDSAAELFASRAPALLDDDTLFITANTDVIDNYIAETCPDRGTLGGLDVEEGE